MKSQFLIYPRNEDFSSISSLHTQKSQIHHLHNQWLKFKVVQKIFQRIFSYPFQTLCYASFVD